MFVPAKYRYKESLFHNSNLISFDWKEMISYQIQNMHFLSHWYFGKKPLSHEVIDKHLHHRLETKQLSHWLSMHAFNVSHCVLRPIYLKSTDSHQFRIWASLPPCAGRRCWSPWPGRAGTPRRRRSTSCSSSSLRCSPSGSRQSSRTSARCSRRGCRSGRSRPGWWGRGCRAGWAACGTWRGCGGPPRCRAASWGCRRWGAAPSPPSRTRGPGSTAAGPSPRWPRACEWRNPSLELSVCWTRRCWWIQSKNN